MFERLWSFQTCPASMTVTMEHACIVFLCVIVAVLGNPATQLPCPETTRCTVSNVDITPCTNPTLCTFKQGRNASINFDIQPQFDATELEVEVSWNKLPFHSLDSEACRYTRCPTVQGITQTVTYNLYLAKKQTSKGTFKIKWRVWNKADPNDLCCFFTNIKIT